jgi:hypothetical protein
MLTVGSIRLVGATVGMTIERETLTVGGTMLVGMKDGNTSVALTDGATTEREALIVGSTRLVGTRDGTTIDELFKVGIETEIEIGGSGVSEGSTIAVEMLSDGATVGSLMDTVDPPGTEMFSEGTGIDSEVVGQGEADDGSKSGTVMLGAGTRDGLGRVDTPPVGKRGKVGATEIPIDAEGVGRIGRLKLGISVTTGGLVGNSSEGLMDRPIDGRGMLDGRTQLAFCASARPRRPTAIIEA